MSLVEPGVSYPRDVVMKGLPTGWRAVEQKYGDASKSAGKTYVRYFSKDGRFKNIGSLKAVYQKDAESNGLKPEVGVKLFEEFRAKEEEERQKKKEEAGVVGKEQREEAIQVFEAQFGKLEAYVVPKMTGWSHTAKYLEGSEQTHILFYNPEGVQFGTVKAVEASLGLRMMKGEDLTKMIKDARDEFIKEHGSLNPGYNPLRRTADGSSLKAAALSGDLAKVAEVEGRGSGPADKRRRLLDEDYVDYADLVVMEATKDSKASRKAGAGAADAKALVQSYSLARDSLTARHFEADTPIIAVLGGGEHQYVDVLRGLYYKTSDSLKGRPCYQHVKSSKGGKTIVCGGRYMCWDDVKHRWCFVVGDLSAPRCLAFNTDDKATPEQLSSPWRVIRKEFGVQAEA
eukprot:TRINITY_DN75244_c0_g1_i1.p1 TRINITY_DN75244_c0_g1~~TRINITY_DN75244_c0_g1_i1.p1  ORF type:complete len:400 (+),score=50.99 TRINITY_DN75244_c0_g1_i1:68-1267(+)